MTRHDVAPSDVWLFTFTAGGLPQAKGDNMIL